MSKGILSKNMFQSQDMATIIANGAGSIYRKPLTLWGVVPEDVEKMFRDGSKAILERHFPAYVEDGVRYESGTE